MFATLRNSSICIYPSPFSSILFIKLSTISSDTSLRNDESSSLEMMPSPYESKAAKDDFSITSRFISSASSSPLGCSSLSFSASDSFYNLRTSASFSSLTRSASCSSLTLSASYSSLIFSSSASYSSLIFSSAASYSSLNFSALASSSTLNLSVSF